MKRLRRWLSRLHRDEDGWIKIPRPEVLILLALTNGAGVGALILIGTYAIIQDPELLVNPP